MPDLTGQSIGRYHILEQLGEGGMATVYKAFDTRLERDVALKIIRIDQFAPAMLDRILKRFEREAKALARLVHTNIVHINDYGEQDGVPYLIMDYLPGGTLKQRLGKPMPWQEAIHLLLPIAEALDYAHSLNIVHRDVKPSNILMTQRDQPMLTDFGIAKILESEETTGLTGTGTGLGTPEYMAPEQWTGQAGPLADLYSLGVVMYELVTGRKPYTADTPAAVMLKQANDPLPQPRQYVPDLPESVENVLFKALAKKTEDRYQSMGEFSVALKKLSDLQPFVTGMKLEEERKEKDEEKTLLAAGEKKKEAEVSHNIPFSVEAGKKPGRRWGWLPWAGGGLLVVLIAILVVVFGNRGVIPLASLATSTLEAPFTAVPNDTAMPVPTVAVPTLEKPPIVVSIPGNKIKIGLSFSDYATERWPIESARMTQMLQMIGYDVIVQEADHDVKLQSDQIDNMVAQGVKGLIVIAEDGAAAITPVEKAVAAGVKVIAYDRLIKTPKISAYLSFDNVEVGRLEALGVMTALGLPGSTIWNKDNPAKVVLSGGSPTDNNAVLVRNGQMQALQPYIESGVVKIVADQWVENWDAAKAEAMMENILTAQQNKIDAVVASNDGTALGELQAMKAQGLAGKVPISGQDASADGCNSIVKGEQTVTVFKDTRLLVPRAVEIIDALIKGQTPPGLMSFPLAVLTNDKALIGNIQAAFLPVVQVNKFNVYDLVVKSGFQPYDLVYRDIPANQLPPKP
jgi:D-xylose transport system substrate-binding protein